MAAVFRQFLWLGATAFGGPVAHLGLFRERFVRRLRWLDEAAFAELLALCQFLPGPTSSQLGFAIGWQRAGWRGGLAAWAGFTLPGALVLGALGLWVARGGAWAPLAAVLHGLAVAATAVVAAAVWGMARALCPDGPRRLLAAGAAVSAFALPPALAPLVLAGAGLVGAAVLRMPVPAPALRPLALPRGVAWAAAAVLVGLAACALAPAGPGLAAQVAGALRAGALVFGGGHAVLPALEASAVGGGWLDAATFLAGYGAVQVAPGPLFNIAAFVGAAAGAGGPAASLVMTLAVFAPGLLLVLATAPAWAGLRRRPGAQAALAGVNAGVVGLLLALLAGPLATALDGPADWAWATAGAVLLAVPGLPPWLVVPLLAGAVAATR